jgi:UDP-N-acetylmuramoyl-tripeptide--D-alanyl-D-alanine ligase
MKKFTFGFDKPKADVNITGVRANPLVEIVFGSHNIQSQLIGLYNANNINAAIAIGKYFGVTDAQIKNAIKNYKPENNRSQLILRNTNTIILDAYNANPSSMAVAIKNWLQLLNPKKIAILGDMFELGNESLAEHKQIVDSLIEHGEVEVMFVGKDFYANRINLAHLHFFETYEDLEKYLSGMAFEQSQILIKGSRGMALERVLELL